MSHDWRWYRFCPVCGRPFGRGARGYLARHGCAGQLTPFASLPLPGPEQIARYLATGDARVNKQALKQKRAKGDE